MELSLYTEINGLCIVILLILFFRSVTDVNRQSSQLILSGVFIANIFNFLFDLLWALVQYGVFQMSIPLNYTFNTAYFITTALASFLWFVYAEYEMRSFLPQSRPFIIISAIPMFILIGLTLLSLKTGWIFTIDETGQYQRGQLYPLQLIIVYGYVLVTGVHAVMKSFDKEGYAFRHKYRTLASFGIVTIGLGSLQVVFPGMPFVCAGITISLLMVFIELQNQRISLDPLTKVNNRNEMIRYLSMKLRHPDRQHEKKLWLLMIDIDFFKKINDRYGHIEGDNALVSVAEALRHICGRYESFIARFGGDEFVMICEISTNSEIFAICDDIHKEINKLNSSKKHAYPITLSIGYTELNDSITSIQEFVREADVRLYEAKSKRKRT